MPFTPDSVEQYRSGLDEEGKKRWCAIANSVLSRCMEAGGSEESCAASAIHQANGGVQANSTFHTISVDQG